MTTNHERTARTLAVRLDCADVVVARLEQLVHSEPRNGRLWSDLSAAYSVRAQGQDRPSDFLRALDAADHAVLVSPRLSELVRESLGLAELARTSWARYAQSERSPWGKEASDRRTRLERAANVEIATGWSLNRQRLADDATIAEPSTIFELVAPYPAAAQRYVEEEVLPAWAEASAHGRPAEAQRHLQRAAAIAAQLERATRDPYVREVVDFVRQSKGAKLQALREAHLALREARRRERVEPHEAIEHFARANELFAATGSPAAVQVQFGITIPRWLTTFDAGGLRKQLEAPEGIAQARGYGNLLSRIEANRANFLVYESRHFDALRHYDLAIGIAGAMHDREMVANAHTRKAGILRTLGHNEEASREALLALRGLPGVVDVASRHFVLAENALAALAHGYPAIALIYQNQAATLVETAIAEAKDQRVLAFLRANLSICLRHRAAIRLRLEQRQRAEDDLAESKRLTDRAVPNDDVVRRALLARIEDVAGRKALQEHDPATALHSLTRALELLFPNEYRTFRATLFVQRAEAHAALGDDRRAEADLLAAVEELRNERQHLIEDRKPGDAEAYWSPYFSRFREAYERLVRLRVDQGRTKEAFAFAQEIRAFEPLNLILQLEVASETFKHWTRSGTTASLETIQDSLPNDTYIVEYFALPDRVYAWIIGKRGFELLQLAVRRQDIEDWSGVLQRNARRNRNDTVDATLEEAGGSLVSKPLEKIRDWAGHDEGTTIVFVPDQAIHGLPLAALRDHDKYVVQDHPVAIAASSTFYLHSLDRDRKLAANRESPSALLVGNPAFDPKLAATLRLANLIWAGHEVAQIRSIHPRTIPLLEEHATVSAFLRAAQDQTIVHFAGHAVANPDAPFRSFLLLAPSPDHNGVLTAEELLARFRPRATRLVVLAACSSAGGAPIGPEGLAPLVRPFIATGVPAVVGSLWDVRDHGSTELVIAFHRHYRAGASAEQALRLAQIEMMNRGGAGSSPLVWGSFQLIGHASSPY